MDNNIELATLAGVQQQQQHQIWKVGSKGQPRRKYFSQIWKENKNNNTDDWA